MDKSNKKKLALGREQLIITVLIVAILGLGVSVLLLLNSERSNNNPVLFANGSTQVDIVKPQSEAVTNTDTSNLPVISIRECENNREFGSITTHLFEVYNTNTDETCKLSEGKLSFEDATLKIESYLSNNPYKTISIGVVDNKFYVQQDTSKQIEGDIKVKIVSLKDGFSSDDWFSLTEAIYNNTDIQADSLFSYQTDTSTKHYIYCYIDNTVKSPASADETQDNIENINEDN